MARRHPRQGVLKMDVCSSFKVFLSAEETLRQAGSNRAITLCIMLPVTAPLHPPPPASICHDLPQTSAEESVSAEREAAGVDAP